jgi:hypothetical protein
VTLAKGAGEGSLDEELVKKYDDNKEQAGGNGAQQQLPYLVDEAGFRLCWGRGRREQKNPELMNHCLHAGVDFVQAFRRKNIQKTISIRLLFVSGESLDGQRGGGGEAVEERASSHVDMMRITTGD